MVENISPVLAGDGLLAEISYISENGIKEYEFKDHYGYDFICGRVKKVACDYINKRVSYYYSIRKKALRSNGWRTVGLAFPRLAVFELDEFFTLDITRSNGSDRVIMHVLDMSEEKFKEKANEIFEREVHRQGDKYILAYA